MRANGYPTDVLVVSDAQPLLERRQLGMQFLRKMVAELREVLVLRRQLFLYKPLVDRQELLHLRLRHVQAGDVDVTRAWYQPNRRLDRLQFAVAAAEDPLEHAAVLAEPRPQELAVLALAEPVHAQDLRQLRPVVLLADLHPVAEVVAHVVPAERQHRERVVTQLADRSRRGGGL